MGHIIEGLPAHWLKLGDWIGGGFVGAIVALAIGALLDRWKRWRRSATRGSAKRAA